MCLSNLEVRCRTLHTGIVLVISRVVSRIAPLHMFAWSPLQTQPSASWAIQGIPASPTLPRLWRVLFSSRAPLCIIHRCRQAHGTETS